MRGSGACPLWLELGLVLLMGSAVSKSVLIGGCGVRLALGTLSADGWVSSHPAGCLALGILALEPVGYWVGPGLDAKMATSVSALAD